MPARFLNDRDIDTLRKGGIDMNAVPVITGDRYDGLKESLNTTQTKTDFLFI